MTRSGEILEDEYYQTGLRTQRAFLLLEGELDALVWAPWWIRRVIVKRVKASTKFDDAQGMSPGTDDLTMTSPTTVGQHAELVERLESVFLPAILHGDEDHRAWLTASVKAFIAGEPIPKPRGSGNKEARITALTTELTVAEKALEDSEEDRYRLLDRAQKAEAENATLREALVRIADPIAAMQRDAELDGAKLNGPVAVELARNAEHLKGIARTALSETPHAN